MLKIFKFIGLFLERSKRNHPRIFWLCTCLLGFCVFHEPVTTSSQYQTVDEQGRILRSDGSKSDSNSFGTLICLSERKNFDLAFDPLSEQSFPDWKERLDYQKTQEKFYISAIKKKYVLKKSRMLDNKSYYTKEELNAMDYFHGTGFYQKQQDPKVKPNVFDTRQSFLRKMEDPIVLDNFLNNFECINRNN